MSEHQFQREPQDHIDVPNETPNSDPLAELAKIVAGEVPGARRDVVVPITPESTTSSQVVETPVALSAPTQAAASEHAVAPPAPTHEPVSAPIAAPMPASPVATNPSADFQTENMDLESQLLAELGVGEPEPVMTPLTMPAPVVAQVAPEPALTAQSVAPVENANHYPQTIETVGAPLKDEAPQPAAIASEEAVQSELAPNEIVEEPISNDGFSDAFSAQMSGGTTVEETAPEPAPISDGVEVASLVPPTADLEPSIEFAPVEEMEAFSTDAFAAISNNESEAEVDSLENSLDDALNELHVETPQEGIDTPALELGVVDFRETEPLISPVQEFVARQDLQQNQLPSEPVANVAQSEMQPLQEPVSATLTPEPELAPAPVDNMFSAPDVPLEGNAEIDFDDGFSEAFGDELNLELSPQSVAENVTTHPPAETAPVQNDEFEAAMFALHQDEIEAQQPAQTAAPNAAPIAASAAVGIPVEQPQSRPPVQLGQEQYHEPQSFQPIDAQFEAPNGDPYDQETKVVLPPARRKYGVGLAAAAIGLALVAGVGFVGYGYFNGSEKVSEPNIVRADPSDFKVKPEVPGGKKIANQDQPVYDSIAGKKSEKTEQESLVETNVEPIELASAAPKTRSFKSSERLATTETAQPTKSGLAAMQPRKVKTVTVRADGTIITSTGGEIANLTALAPDSEPLAAPRVELPKTNSIDGASTTGDIAIPSPNPSRKSAKEANVKTENVVLANSVPVTKVKTATRSLKTPELVTPTPVSVSSIKPTQAAVSAPVTSAEFVVQISSQRSQEAAEATYQNLKRRFASLLSDRSREIREATVDGKGTFYRVRIPVGSQSAAAEFCGRYKSAGGSCFVTR